jgi:1-aminocyclopropane-1-carboxylate deaminase/D-cysteine desulfhydrase-like pyridoxal-dependent ACC family enzyme
MAIDPDDPGKAPGVIRDLAARLGTSDAEVHLDEVSLFGGYGEPTEHEASAILRLARTEGILLDPVYTGRAFAGLLHRAEEGSLTGPVLYWHTGGLPALFTGDAGAFLN